MNSEVRVGPTTVRCQDCGELIDALSAECPACGVDRGDLGGGASA